MRRGSQRDTKIPHEDRPLNTRGIQQSIDNARKTPPAHPGASTAIHAIEIMGRRNACVTPLAHGLPEIHLAAGGEIL